MVKKQPTSVSMDENDTTNGDKSQLYYSFKSISMNTIHDTYLTDQDSSIICSDEWRRLKR